MTDRSVHDGASFAPLRVQESGERKRKEPAIIRYFRETAGPARPDPWVNRKYAVGLLWAIAGWCAYVIIGRVCVPVFQGTSTSRFSIADAAGLLAGYIIVMLLLGWSYIRIITAGPGHAKDLVAQCAPPQANMPMEAFTHIPPTDQASAPMSYHTETNDPQFMSSPDQQRLQLPPDSLSRDDVAPEPSELAPITEMFRSAISHPNPDEHSSSGTLISDDPPQETLVGAKRKMPDWRTVERPLPDLHYGPRYCRFCHINKPDRTHHCRHCGTCILQFDHHCPWIGQCVGWANHKFFMIFNFWAIIYWYYHLILLVIYLTQAEIDGQVIGVIALSGLFGIFTTMMLFQHFYLITTGKSTVEAFAGRDQDELETQHLSIQFGFWSHYKEKKLVRKKWNDEFGGTAVDERWREGSRMDMWRREMGDKWYGWILPIGRPLGDGMHFPSNPRFGSNGEWLKKVDWPKGVE